MHECSRVFWSKCLGSSTSSKLFYNTVAKQGYIIQEVLADASINTPLTTSMSVQNNSFETKLNRKHEKNYDYNEFIKNN